MSNISFVNVWLLFIAVPLFLAVFVPFFIAVGKENRNGHSIASMVLHLCLAVMVAFAAAGTKIETVVTETNVYVVADVSYSADKNLDTLDNYIGQLQNNLPRNTKMGIVAFGKDCELLTQPGEKIESVKTATVDRSETNIVSALEYTGTLFRGDVIKRIVLITDGKESDTRSNALKRAVDTLRASKIYVDAIYLDDNLRMQGGEDSAYDCEVQISSADYTHHTYLNNKERAAVLVESSFATEARIFLLKDGAEIAKRTERLNVGPNNFSFELDTVQSGTFDYQFRIEADGDESSYNNTYSFMQTVSGAKKVLLICGSQEDASAFEKIGGDTLEVEVFANKADVPYAIEDLCKYDEFVLSNVDVTKLNNSAMLLESLEMAVSQFGRSLITFGNVYIQSYENGELKPLEKMLPIRYGKNDQDPKLYTIVIDSSRSMEQLGKFARAKRAAARLIEILEPTDNVCVVTFNGDVSVVQTPVEVGDGTKLISAINELDAKNGTVIGSGLKRALEQIRLLPFRDKQVLLISDGRSYTNEPDDPLSAASALYAYGIAVSTLNIGSEKDDQEAVAQKLLKDIASYGGGESYSAKTDEELQDIFFKEISDDVKDTIVDRDTWVNVNKPYDDVLKGVGDFENSYVSGYVRGSIKASATTVLTVDFERTNGGVAQAPLYAYWKYGDGRVASFASNLSGAWVSNWHQTGTDTAFFANVVGTNTPKERVDVPYTVGTNVDGKYARVEINPAVLHAGAVAEITVTCPNGEEVSTPMVFDSSVYFHEFEASEIGKYSIRIAYSYANGNYETNADFVISYAPEYDSFTAFDASSLHRAIVGEGEVSLDGNLTIENDEKEIGVYTLELAPILLITAVSLYVVDIIVRKLKWNDIKSLFGRGKK